MIENIQGGGITKISGRDYYHLKCTISDAKYHHAVMTGLDSKMYSEKQFIRDFNNNIGGFQVTFDGTEEKHHFRWKQLIDCLKSFMFFGTPLTMTRAFDSIFRGIVNVDRIHH